MRNFMGKTVSSNREGCGKYNNTCKRESSPISEGWQRGRSTQEPRVCHLLNGLTNGQDEGGVHEGHNDISIKLIYMATK